MMLWMVSLAASISIAATVPGTGSEDPAGRTSGVPYKQVQLGGPFWTPRLSALTNATLAANRHQCDITGRITNFERAAAKLKGEASPGPFQGLLFNDSDVYKMMQGWATIIATETDPVRKAALDKELDALIAKVAAAQMPDGYIDTYYTLKAGAEKRFTREESDHETYCMGHLIEAGAVHYLATGKKNFLDVAIRAADFLRGLYAPDRFTAPPGHEELELALVKLAAATGQEKYAQFAHDLVEMRGRPHRKLDGTQYGPWGEYWQDHKPVAEQFEAAGHAVRAGYLYSAMADLAILGHAEYTPALDSLWDDITQRRIFVTGGIGPSGSNEGFTVPYDIPTQSAYQETCASIALCLWAHRMFLLEGQAKYMEQFERTLYNAALAGVSLDGKQFFYVNPLASHGGHLRRDWYDCACCPPNVVRFFGALGDYVYAVRDKTVYVNLFMESKASVQVGDSKTVQSQQAAGAAGNVTIEQKTAYPLDGKIHVAVHNGAHVPIVLAIRGGAGPKSPPVDADGYSHVPVAPEASVELDWEIPVHAGRVYSDPRVKATFGHAAIMRGPLVYAAESTDNPGVPLADVIVPPTAAIRESIAPDGTAVLTVDAYRATASDSSDAGRLYQAGAVLTPATLTLRPYYTWANRGDSQMSVWWPESAQFIAIPPHKGVKITMSHAYSGEGSDAVLDGTLPDAAKGSADESIPRMTFWPHKGTTEWIQYDFDRPHAIRSASVYWFDDTGRGGCRVPAGATIEYKDGQEWKPVPNNAQGAIGVEKNALNATRFQPVTTKALRLSIKLQDKMSGGVLEWAFGE